MKSPCLRSPRQQEKPAADPFSTDGKLVVWGLVVWNFLGAPLSVTIPCYFRGIQSEFKRPTQTTKEHQKTWRLEELKKRWGEKAVFTWEFFKNWNQGPFKNQQMYVSPLLVVNEIFSTPANPAYSPVLAGFFWIKSVSATSCSATHYWLVWSSIFFWVLPGKREKLVGAQPPANCSFARLLVGKTVILAAHLLITINTKQIL